jgi:hypothetical protein
MATKLKSLKAGMLAGMAGKDPQRRDRPVRACEAAFPSIQTGCCSRRAQAAAIDFQR